MVEEPMRGRAEEKSSQLGCIAPDCIDKEYEWIDVGLMC